MDPFMHYGLAAGIQAFQDSGVEVREENADRIGVAIGAGIGGLWGIEQGRLMHRGWRAKEDFTLLYPEQHHQYDRR